MPKVIDLGSASAGAFNGVRLVVVLPRRGAVLCLLQPDRGHTRRQRRGARLFGSVSSRVLPSGVHLVVPFTRVVKMSIQTQEMKEVAEVPSQEGLIMDLEVSLLLPARCRQGSRRSIKHRSARNYASVVVEPQIRSAIREITASYEAKALYSAERDKIAREIFAALHEAHRRPRHHRPRRCCCARSGCRRWSPTRSRRSSSASRRPSR